jgi:hypothetical protein
VEQGSCSSVFCTVTNARTDRRPVCYTNAVTTVTKVEVETRTCIKCGKVNPLADFVREKHGHA